MRAKEPSRKRRVSGALSAAQNFDGSWVAFGEAATEFCGLVGSCQQGAPRPLRHCLGTGEENQALLFAFELVWNLHNNKIKSARGLNCDTAQSQRRRSKRVMCVASRDANGHWPD